MFAIPNLQRILLAIAILEIPLQLDTYLFDRKQDAEFGAIAGLNVSILTCCLCGLYGLWLIEAAASSDLTRRKWVVGGPFLLYLLAVGLSVVAARAWQLSFFDFALLLQAYLLFLYLANNLREHRDLVFVMSVLAGCLLLQSLIIIGCEAVGTRFGSEIELAGRGRILIDLGGRPGGTCMSPVVAGSFLALLLIPASSLLFAPVSRRLRQFAFVAVCTGTLAVAFTQTRGAIITVVVAAVIFGSVAFYRGWLPKWAPAVALGLALVSAVPILAVIKQRVQGDDGGSAEARLHLAAIAAEIIAGDPILGVGAGNSHLAAKQVANASPFRGEWFYTIHSKYLVVLAETGVMGFAAFFAMLVCALRYGWLTWQARDPVLSLFALALFAAIVGHMIHMAVDIFNSRIQVQILWCCAGVLAALFRLTVLDAAAEPAINTDDPLPIAGPHVA